LVAGGDHVTVLVPHAQGVREEWDDEGVEVKSFRYAPTRMEVVGYSRSLLSDERPKWGVAAMAPLYLLAAGWALAKELRHRAYDLLQAHWVVPNALAALPQAGRLPLVVGLHGSDVFLAERPVVRPFVRRALRRTAILTGCSPELVSRVCALGFPQERSRVIPYGVDTEVFSPDPARRSRWRQRLGIPDSASVVLGVGRMATKKGFQVLLEVLDEVLAVSPEVHLVLAGEGDRLGEFRHKAQARSERVFFPGAVQRDTLPDLYRAADVFVLPAVHDPAGNVDGLPNVILEAMATGLPVVASAISGIPLAIGDGQEGLLVPEKDGTALSQALGRLLDSEDLRRRLGEAGRHKAERELTWTAVARSYRAAYQDALANPRHRPRT
jgi:phosphatidylinositol alpha-1,6-mannosyltransferase